MALSSEDILKQLSMLFDKEDLIKKQINTLYIELEQTKEDIDMCQTAYMYAKNREERNVNGNRSFGKSS
jgi:hypothetical protein